jgi:DNA ligase 1
MSLVRKTKPSKEDLEESKQKVKFVIYDAIVNGTFEERNEFLCDVERYFGAGVEVLETNVVNNEDGVQEQLGEYLAQGYEGMMLRDPQGMYEGKRSKHLLKYKEFEDAEFEVVRIIEGQGNWAGYAKSVEIRLPDGTTQQSGMRGSQDQQRLVLQNADAYIGTEVTVRYQNKTADGKLRFPVVVAFWKGKRDL